MGTLAAGRASGRTDLGAVAAARLGPALNAAGTGLRRAAWLARTRPRVARWPRPGGGPGSTTSATTTPFREGLRVLVDSFEAGNDVHAFGRLFFREFCVSLLVNRLKIEADLTRHPEILDVPVDRPLIITGLPAAARHSCIADVGRPRRADDALLGGDRAASPPPRPENHATDPRIARAAS